MGEDGQYLVSHDLNHWTWLHNVKMKIFLNLQFCNGLQVDLFYTSQQVHMDSTYQALLGHGYDECFSFLKNLV